MNRIRVALGILLVLAFVLQGLVLSARMMLGLFQDATVGHDPATRGEKRFHAVLQRLPARGVYGYRAGGPLRIGKHQEVEGDDRAIAQYVTAQYALAPRILDLGPGRPLAILDDADAVRVLSREDR